MSDPNGGGNKTVFRPSPLQALKGGQTQGSAEAGQAAPWLPPTPAGGGYDTPPPLSRSQPVAPSGSAAPSRLADDDVPLPATPRSVRNLMLTEAGPVLALAAGVRAGRARTALPRFHRQAMQSIAAFEQAIQPHYSEEARQRAKYALCATIDDIAQNLPNQGTDGAEWARRSLVIAFFQENIGGDRFWQLVDDMLRAPAEHLDLIELYHACLAAGFEGRFRVMPDGRRRLHEIMSRLQSGLGHARSLPATELSPQWKGENAPRERPGFWIYLAGAAAAVAALLLLVFIVLRLMLMSSGEAPSSRLAGLAPDDRLRLSRTGAALPPPAASAQADTLRTFLAPEIARHEVTVEEDAGTVRVRTTVGALFQSGSDQLEAGRAELFGRIGQAVEGQPGAVTVEGHADSDKITSLAFPDNMALSQARADKVAGIVRDQLTDASRVTAKGMGDTVPLTSNDTAEGKTRNRRVEVIVPRHN